MRPELIRAADLLRLNTPEAVEEAIGLLQNTVYSFSMKVCGHPEDAEDTMQEVLFRSIGHLGQIADPQALAVWLYTVTRNRCWRMRRKPAHAPAHMLSLDELMPNRRRVGVVAQGRRKGPGRQPAPRRATSPSPSGDSAHSGALRIVLVLHDMEELTTEQVAQILDLQQGTVRIRLHRARLSVRKEMSKLLSGSENSAEPLLARKSPSDAQSKSKQRPDECRDLFANLSEYLDGRVEPATCDQMQDTY